MAKHIVAVHARRDTTPAESKGVSLLYSFFVLTTIIIIDKHDGYQQ
jgi:hypothetical protein